MFCEGARQDLRWCEGAEYPLATFGFHEPGQVQHLVAKDLGNLVRIFRRYRSTVIDSSPRRDLRSTKLAAKGKKSPTGATKSTLPSATSTAISVCRS
jgi:hypothetical protein